MAVLAAANLFDGILLKPLTYEKLLEALEYNIPDGVGRFNISR